jgi:hypothetical protein
MRPNHALRRWRTRVALRSDRRAEHFKQLVPQVPTQGCFNLERCAHRHLCSGNGTFLSFLPWIKRAQQLARTGCSSSSSSTVSMCFSLTPYTPIARQPVRCPHRAQQIEDEESPTQSYVSATKACKEKGSIAIPYPPERRGIRIPRPPHHTTTPIISFPSGSRARSRPPMGTVADRSRGHIPLITRPHQLDAVCGRRPVRLQLAAAPRLTKAKPKR